MSKQLLCAFHGGPPLLGHCKPAFFGRYRRREWWPMVQFIQHPRLYDDCSFLEKRYLLTPPVDIERLEPKYYTGKKRPVVGHFPRNTGTGLKTKGHDKIIDILFLMKSQLPYVTDTKFIDWIPHIERVNSCDICVEKLSVILGEWGLTALEAAALGKIVITNFWNRSTYEKIYGPSPIIGVENKRELHEALMDIAEWDTEKIQKKQRETRAWAEKHHTFEAVGKRLKDILVKEGAAL